MSLPLDQLQAWFVALMTDARPLEKAAQTHADLVHGARLEQVLAASDKETPEERFAVYRHAYFARLVECLEGDYPGLLHLWGSEAFADEARAYAERYPSRSPSLNGFGRHMAEFLAERPQPDAFAIELARLEWALVEAIHSPPSPTLQTEALVAVGARLAEVRFIPHQSSQLFTFAYPVNEYLQAYFQDEAPSRPSARESSVVVVRLGYKVWRLDLSPPQRLVLGRLWAGEPLGRAFEGVDVGPDEAQAWFRLWTEKGLFSGVE